MPLIRILSSTTSTRMINRLFRLSTVLLAAAATSLTAQTGGDQLEEQAIEILRLYEQGRTDTAYWLVEPLKRNARFVPAALFVRAQMTPDDRALNLYREVIALEPTGPWADDAAFQLVRRYVAKRDSLGAEAWLSVLASNYPQSPFISQARSLVGRQESWSFTDDRSGDRDDLPDDGRDEEEVAVTDDAESDDSDPEAEETEDPERFSGFALQVGLLPTESAAERHAETMRAAGLQPHVFEKAVDGRSSWAVVVGPYSSIAEAAADKARVVKACGCGAFTVQVD